MRNRSNAEINVILIRHAPTKGNIKRRYIGVTDEDIVGADCLRGKYPPCDIVVSSPMKRCMQTAGILYPNKTPVICNKLSECDFGNFENKSYEDLKDNARYTAWLESGGELPFPGGEKRADFIKRSIEGFFEMLPECGTITYVVHGGSIMAIMQSLFGGDFYDYQVKNGCGYKFKMKGNTAYDYGTIGSALHSVSA